MSSQCDRNLQLVDLALESLPSDAEMISRLLDILFVIFEQTNDDFTNHSFHVNLDHWVREAHQIDGERRHINLTSPDHLMQVVLYLTQFPDGFIHLLNFTHHSSSYLVVPTFF